MKSILAAILITLAMGNPARAEIFSFPQAGFSIDMPDGWHVVEGEEYVRIHRNVDTRSEEVNRGLAAPRIGRLAVVVRDAATAGVNPGIHLDYHPGRIADIDAAFGLILAALGDLSDFTLLEGPGDAQLGPFEAGVVRYSYSIVSNK